MEETCNEELIRAHLNGSAEAFKRLLERHAPELVSLLERMLNDHHLALDITQEVFIKLHGMLPRYRFEGRFRSMLYSMALNRARDALRKKKRSRTVFLGDSRKHRDEALVPDPAEKHDLRTLIEEALDKVPDPFRQALYLRDVAGLSYSEAAETLGCSLGTVKSRVNRGRLAFRDIYLSLTKDNNFRSKGESPKGELPKGGRYAP